MKVSNKRISYILIIILMISFVNLSHVFAEDNVIIVYCARELRKINKKVFGNNFIGYDPTTYEKWDKKYYGYSDYGAGIWDPKWNESVKDVINLAKEAGITIVRFPGGCGTHHYNWKNAIGKKREYFLYGIDEFLKTCEEIGSEAVITVSYFTGHERDAADLVEYLNSSSDGSNPNGGIDWAKIRAKNGHPEPYNVEYFEIGNEVYHGNHQSIKEVLPEEYAHEYLKYYEAMKTIDPTIKIGVILYTSNWNESVLEIVKDKVDFGIIHSYPTPIRGRGLEQMDPKDIFKVSWTIPIFKDEMEFKNILKLFKEKSGKEIPLAITEYNGGFAQEKSVPYRHCLGNALLNAELLRIFMKPEHNILMANNWNFVNEYWGMIKSQENFIEHDYRFPINYIKRPNYYVFELYHNHFGSKLLAVDIECNGYKLKGHSIPYLSVNSSINDEQDKIYLMVVNKNLEESITATIDLKDFNPAGKGEAWILNGPSVDATNEDNPNNVKFRHKKFKIESNPFQFTFEPHSLTAIEIKRNE